MARLDRIGRASEDIGEAALTTNLWPNLRPRKDGHVLVAIAGAGALACRTLGVRD
jgi:hypothetical protein